jgi:putative alpha-1,2-mannosidase
MKASTESPRKDTGLLLRPFCSAALLGLLCFCLHALPAQTAPAAGPAASVNPFIGTGEGPGGGVNLFPGAAVPFGMVQLSPDTENHGYGYHYAQTDMQGFSMTHMSGPGCANEGEVFFTATDGPVHTRPIDLRSAYSHSDEAAAPGYYRVNLLQWNIDAELSATERTGMAQFTFPAGQAPTFSCPSATRSISPPAHPFRLSAIARWRVTLRTAPSAAINKATKSTS